VSSTRKWLLPAAGISLVLLGWQVYVSLQSNHYLTASVAEIFQELGSNWRQYWDSAVTTAGEAGLGFVVGNVLAILVATWMAYSQNAERLVYPYAIGLKATPVVALAPLMVRLFGLGFIAKAVCAAVVCFFPIIVQLPGAFRRIPDDLLDLFKSFGATEPQVFTKLRLPLAAPDIFAALKTSSTLAVVGAIVGEFMSPDRGVGYHLVYASAHGEGPHLLATTVVATMIGIGFFLVVHGVERLVVTWKSDVL
jgi:NitT/TauT family transport system permease protein